MQAKSSASEQRTRTFTESARRAQIVQAAIEVIADIGYAKTSFAKIADRSGLSSTGMISYHFKGKDDLLREVVTEVMRVSAEYMEPRIEAADGYRSTLRTYIESNIALLEIYPKHLQAVTEVLTNLRGDDPQRIGFAESTRALMERQERYLREGQAAGQFRDFDPHVMITALRGAIDSLVVRLASDPGLDVAACGRELADIFDLATRRAP